MPQPSTETGIIIFLALTNVCQLLLQLAQLYFGSKKDSKDLLITDLQSRLTNLENDSKEKDIKIRQLETQVFDLTKEKAYLDGQLQATQKRKEDLAKGV